MGTEGKTPDITGTRDDNTMTVEGEGAEGMAPVIAGDEELVKRSQAHNDKRPPCEKYGHLPKHYKASDGNSYPVDPPVCRTCGSPM